MRLGLVGGQILRVRTDITGGVLEVAEGGLTGGGGGGVVLHVQVGRRHGHVLVLAAQLRVVGAGTAGPVVVAGPAATAVPVIVIT